jgi:hypothetical protein
VRDRKRSVWGLVVVAAGALLLALSSSSLAAPFGARTCTRVTAVTLRPTSVTATSALLRGQVDACRTKGVQAWFQVTKPTKPPTHGVAIPADGSAHTITFKLTGLTAQEPISYRVVAKFGKLTLDGKIVTFSTAPPAKLRVTAPANVTAGQTFRVSATGLSSQGTSEGNVTSHTKFTLSPDGSCTGSSCRATEAGAHTVHARDATAIGSSPTAVAAGPLNHLQLSPGAATVCPQFSGAGADYSCGSSYSQSYSAEGFDVYGNSLGDRTADTTFSISAPGSCTAASCSVGDSTSPETVTGLDGTAQGSAELTGSDTLTMTCQGEHYDVNNDSSDGCEHLQPSLGHTTQATALDEGSYPCSDGASQVNQPGVILSDSRTHTNPTVSGFDTTVGSAPYWIKETATGGFGCSNDYSLTFTTSGGGTTACYKATIITDKLQASTQPLTGSGHETITGDSGSYTDNTTLYIEVQKVCNLPVQDAVSWTLSWHL